jgi:thiamine-monophosphate kinase
LYRTPGRRPARSARGIRFYDQAEVEYLNEFEAIRRFAGRLPAKPPEVVVPIGDDCAVVRLGGELWVAAADMLVEGRHFVSSWSSPEDVGYKAVAVNVSDVAAMGGTPRFVLSSGGAPDSETVSRCMRGVLEACEAFGVYPLGGDTTGADALTVDVAILGRIEGEPVLRSGARPGDLLAVTGELGASAAGLLALENDLAGYERLKDRHRRPEPRIGAGPAAVRMGASAMIDLSDGLASDLRHVCRASGVGCRVDLGLLPVSEDTRALASSVGREPALLAATGGEDYELLMSLPEGRVDALRRELDVPLSVVGEFTEDRKVVALLLDGEPVEGLSGWDHFAAP